MIIHNYVEFLNITLTLFKNLFMHEIGAGGFVVL